MQLKYLITTESITLKSNTFISILFAWKRTVYMFTSSLQFLRENVAAPILIVSFLGKSSSKI